MQRSVLATKEELLGPDHPDVAAGLMHLANLVGFFEGYAEPEGMLLRALDIYKKSLGEEHPDYADVLLVLGEMLSRCR